MLFNISIYYLIICIYYLLLNNNKKNILGKRIRRSGRNNVFRSEVLLDE
jgi:hypothetical protein